jgi:5-methylcytosine-specific restriction endonuclease McrA
MNTKALYCNTMTKAVQPLKQPQRFPASKGDVVAQAAKSSGDGPLPRRRVRGSQKKSPVVMNPHQGAQSGSSTAVGAAAAGLIHEAVLPGDKNVAYGFLNRYRALVLDAGYRPIDVMNWQRAIVMDLLEKADVLEYYDATINSVSEQFFLPAVIRARWYGTNVGRLGRVPLNRRNIMLRDGLKCQYCGKGSNLTLDHVIPQSKGGPNSWENLVTACAPCNTRKGDSTLRELRWKLAKQPKEPSPWDMGIVLPGLGIADIASIPDEWSNYLFGSGSDTD